MATIFSQNIHPSADHILFHTMQNLESSFCFAPPTERTPHHSLTNSPHSPPRLTTEIRITDSLNKRAPSILRKTTGSTAARASKGMKHPETFQRSASWRPPFLEIHQRPTRQGTRPSRRLACLGLIQPQHAQPTNPLHNPRRRPPIRCSSHPQATPSRARQEVERSNADNSKRTSDHADPATKDAL